MGYRLNRLGEPVFMAVSKLMQTEFGIHHRLESCALYKEGRDISYIVKPPPVSVDCYSTPLLDTATVFATFLEGHFKSLFTGVGTLLLTHY